MTDAGSERPRAVFTLGAARHGDRALADALCAGSFIHAGERREFGLEPGWEADGGTDAWHHALAAFDWGLDLAHAYHETAELRFLATWERLVLSWIARGRLEHAPPALTARRIESWIAAWDAFASAPGFEALSAGVSRRIVTSLRTQVRHLHWQVTAEPTAFPGEAHAILVATLAFPRLDASGALLAFATTALRAHLRHAVLADGVHGAGRLARHAEMLRPLLGLEENARRFGLAIPPEYGAALERACDVLLHCRSATSAGCPPASEVLAHAAALFQRGDFLWAATRGARGVPPARRNVGFSAGGYQVQRSPWAACPLQEERFCLLDVGPASDPAHPLHLEITACGHVVVARRGGDAPHPTVRLVGRRTAPGLDIVHGHAFDGERDAWHERHVVFVADEYWIIRDRLHDPDARHHELRFEVVPLAEGHTGVELRDGNAVLSAPGLSVVVASRHTPADAGLLGGPAADPSPGRVLSVVADGVADAEVNTLVVPHAPGRGAPTITVHDGFDTTVLEVRGVGPDGDAVDWIGWAPCPAPLPLGEFRVRATAAWIRQATDGKVLALGASDAAAEEPATAAASPGPTATLH